VKLIDRLRRRASPQLLGRELLTAFADAHPDAFFVEIGSHDGQHHDHLKPFIERHGWRGVMVEPVPYVFARLHAHYGANAGLTLVNVAIADRDGTLPLYHLRDATPEERAHLPWWYDATGSFSRDVLLGHAAEIPDVEERIVEREVPTLTFDSLMERHGTGRLDLLLVDTEGYDWEVVRRVDLERYRPRLVIYEHFHLSDGDRAATEERFASAGYEALQEGMDTFCLDARVDDALLERFRAAEPRIPGYTRADTVARP
jgi:FkbM family methyltransferase